MGAVELGFFKPLMVIIIISPLIMDEEEFMLDKVMLFSILLKLQTGDIAIPVPLTLAHAADDVSMETADGSMIFIFPADDKASKVVIVKTYEVFALTDVVVIETFPDSTLDEAVSVAVPCILIKPLR